MKTINDPGLDQLEEDVIAALVRLLVGHPGFLQEIDVNEAAGEFAHVVEVDPDELAKPRRVVVSDGFGIAVGFQDRIGVHNPIFEVGFLLCRRFTVHLFLALGSSKNGKVGDHFLGVLGFTGTRLASDLGRAC